MVEYKVLWGQGPHAEEELAKKVNQAISEGWEPYGGISATYSERARYATLYQVVVRRDSN